MMKKDVSYYQKKILLTNIPFSLRTYNDFKDTDMYFFLNNYLKPEIFDEDVPLISVMNEKSNIVKEYPEISKRMEDIKRRIKKLKND